MKFRCSTCWGRLAFWRSFLAPVLVADFTLSACCLCRASPPLVPFCLQNRDSKRGQLDHPMSKQHSQVPSRPCSAPTQAGSTAQEVLPSAHCTLEGPRALHQQSAHSLELSHSLHHVGNCSVHLSGVTPGLLGLSSVSVDDHSVAYKQRNSEFLGLNFSA